MMERKKINIRAVIQASVLGVVVLFFGFINMYDKEEPELRFIDVSDSQDFYGGGFVSSESLAVGSYYKLGSAIAVGVFSLDNESLHILNGNKSWPIASLTKLMTALVVDDNIPKDRSIVIEPEHIRLVDGAFYGTVLAGEEYTVSDLNKAILLVSSNVAAEALAGAYGRDEFINLMNEYALQIGMEDTRFIDPTGLSVRNQSTVNDLYKLVSFILENKPEIFSISRRAFEVIYNLRDNPQENLQDNQQGNQEDGQQDDLQETEAMGRGVFSTNQFAGRGDFIGGKTGTIPEAVGNLISVFAISPEGGRIIIILGSEDRFRETENLLQKWR